MLIRHAKLLALSLMLAVSSAAYANNKAPVSTVADHSYTLDMDVSRLNHPVSARIHAWGGESEPRELAKFDVIDGKAHAEGEIPFARKVSLSFYNSNDEIIHKREFVLEPGKLEFNIGRHQFDYEIKGGKYNDIVLNSWSRNPDYIQDHIDFNNYKNELKAKGIKPSEKEMDKYRQLKKSRTQVKDKIVADLAANHSDPVVRMLAIQFRAYKDWDETLAALKALTPAMPENTALQEVIANWTNEIDNLNREKSLQPGIRIRNFSAPTEDGEVITLSKELAKHKLVLVEFWASWCAPCRAEIPSLKKAYKSYHAKGFEIISFSVDGDRESWVEAMEEEEMPWTNVSDLQAFDSPITKQYGITGVPVNYLVDGASGRIVDRNLRGERLNEVLAKYLK